MLNTVARVQLTYFTMLNTVVRVQLTYFTVVSIPVHEAGVMPRVPCRNFPVTGSYEDSAVLGILKTCEGGFLLQYKVWIAMSCSRRNQPFQQQQNVLSNR